MLLVAFTWAIISADLGAPSLLDAVASAGQHGNFEVVVETLEAPTGAQALLSTDLSSNTALHLAVTNGHAEIVRLLVAAGADVDASNNRMETPLFLASRLHGAVGSEVAVALVSAGANANTHPPGGYSPLHNCARNGNVDLCRVLLETGQANANIKTSQGQTPLHLAVRNDDAAMAQLLMMHGSRLNQPNNFGLSPLQMASPTLGDLLSADTKGEGGSDGQVSAAQTKAKEL